MFYPIKDIPGLTLSETKWKPTFPNVVCYQIFMRSFADGNGDGIGDLEGIRKKLHYLKELGIGAIWLTPIFESPSYHKYDIVNYYAIDKEYGTPEDLKQLVAEAHALGLKVILDFVANHTSSSHPWFQEARKGNTLYKDFYCWSTDATEWNKAPGSWHWINDIQKGPEKYYGLFWREMPDLNYDNPNVRTKILEAAQYWIREYDIDGYRLDAASHIYPLSQKEKMHTWWKQFAKSVRLSKPNFYLVGEMWGDDKLIAPFLKAGMNAGFNFDLWFNLKASINEGKDLVTHKLFEAYSNFNKHTANFGDAVILSNHDNPRLMSEVHGNSKKFKTAIAIQMTLPYTPFIYYGDELGMYGPKPDEQIREPFLWGKEDTAQCTWESNINNKNTSSLTEQITSNDSIFQTYKQWIAFRNASEILSEGELHPSPTQHLGILSYVRQWKGKRYLVFHNLTQLSITLKLSPDTLPIQLVLNTDDGNEIVANQIKMREYSTIIICD